VFGLQLEERCCVVDSGVFMLPQEKHNCYPSRFRTRQPATFGRISSASGAEKPSLTGVEIVAEKE